MRYSVIVVTFNSQDFVVPCLESVLTAADGAEMEVVVVDNNSSDDSVRLVRERFPEVKLMENEVNLGFARACNQGYGVSTGEFVFLVNPDAMVSSEALRQCLAFMEGHPKCGMCSGEKYSREKGKSSGARTFPGPLKRFFMQMGFSKKWGGRFSWMDTDYLHEVIDKPRVVDWVDGSFGCIRRVMLERIGFFDERFFLYCEEVDLCLRAKQGGWEVWYLPEVRVRHEAGKMSEKVETEAFEASGSQVESYRMMAEFLYFRKHGGLLWVFGALALELLTYGIEVFKNYTYRLVTGKRTKINYMRKAQRLIKAFFRTKWGSYSPPAPW